MTQIAQNIRPLALGIIIKDGKVLAIKWHDKKKQEDFYRLLGGGVEFGERAEEALKREFMEELGEPIVINKLLGVIENIFEYEGQPGHEICFVYDIAFQNQAAKDKDSLPMIEAIHRGKSATYVDVHTPRIYPLGALELIR